MSLNNRARAAMLRDALGGRGGGAVLAFVMGGWGQRQGVGGGGLN